MALMLLVERQEGRPACKNWVVGYPCGYLSGAICKWFACGLSSDITIVCGHNMVSMLWGNTAYCVKLHCEAHLLRYSNKFESVDFRRCPHDHYPTNKVTSQ